MANREEPFVENEYYHIYNRGNTKQKIFVNDKDRDRFIKLLYLCNSTKNIKFLFFWFFSATKNEAAT